MAYLDWLYSEPGVTLTNWGIEGVSYEVDENGNKKFIKEFLDEQISLTLAGLRQPGLSGIRLNDAWMASLSEEDAASLEMGLEYVNKNPAQHLIRYTEDEQIIYDTYALSCYNYANAQWVKFLLGQRDLAEFDQVMGELKAKYHYDELMEIHKAALARVKEKYGV